MDYRILFLLILVSSILFSCSKDNPTNNNNNKSDTVKICDQIWMTKNLDVDHYRNGDSIPEVRDTAQWVNLTSGAWCYYNNDPAMGSIYGKLYNWYAVNDPRGLAPKGWHIASDEEWTILGNCLGGNSVAGGKLKEVGTTHWRSPNTGATNESGFTAIPGGFRYLMWSFHDIRYNGFWWTSTEINEKFAWARGITYDGSYIGRGSGNNNKNVGFSVRCIKDN